MCQHKNTEEETYLNACKFAGCQLNGSVTYHMNCGTQQRLWCVDCGVLLYDSTYDEIETKEVKYMCSLCKEKGIQPDHSQCGTTYQIPK